MVRKHNQSKPLPDSFVELAHGISHYDAADVEMYVVLLPICLPSVETEILKPS